MKNTNVTYRQLRAFVMLADIGSFTLAASQLGLTQSGLSVLIRELEKEVGTRLFDRSSRAIQLTAPGREFYPLVRRTLNDLAEALAVIEDLKEARRGRLAVGVPQMLACTRMPAILAEFMQLHPDATDHMIDGELSDHLAAVAAGDIDLAVGPDAEPVAGIAASLLVEDEVMLVCSPAHPLGRKKVVRWADLRAETLISPSRDFLDRLLANLDGRLPGRVSFGAVREAAYFTSAIGMARAGLGVTFCPAFARELIEGYGLTMRSLEDPVFRRKIFVYTPAKRSVSPMAAAFIAFLRTHFVAQSR